MSREHKQTHEQSWLSREDLQDLAKIGGDLLKRTVTSSIDVLKDVTDSLPKDAQTIISRSREEVLKGLSRDFAQHLVSMTVEKFFTAVRSHRLDISIRVRKDSESQPNPSPEPNVNAQPKSERKPVHGGDSARSSSKKGFPHRNHRP
jgi:hypothetical protein